MQRERKHILPYNDELGQMRFSPVLARNVKRLRSGGNITKTRLALMVGIGRPLLDKIENGISNVRLAVIASLADSLDTTPAFLLTEHTDKEIRDEIERRIAPVGAGEKRHTSLC